MAIVPPWISPYDQLPNNKQTVWIRVLSMYGQINQAEYNSIKKTFTTITTEIEIPAYQISRWRI